MASPQTSGQAPQSWEQDVHDSSATHAPSPQTTGGSQMRPLQMYPPQQLAAAQSSGWQSAGQPAQLSLAAQKPSPHTSGQAPQSCGHDVHDSDGEHVASPQMTGRSQMRALQM